MECWRLYFLSLGIFGRVASPLPHRLIVPLTVYGQCSNTGVGMQGGAGEAYTSRTKFLSWPGFEPEPLEWQSRTLTTRPPSTRLTALADLNVFLATITKTTIEKTTTTLIIFLEKTTYIG